MVRPSAVSTPPCLAVGAPCWPAGISLPSAGRSTRWRCPASGSARVLSFSLPIDQPLQAVAAPADVAVQDRFSPISMMHQEVTGTPFIKDVSLVTVHPEVAWITGAVRLLHRGRWTTRAVSAGGATPRALLVALVGLGRCLVQHLGVALVACSHPWEGSMSPARVLVMIDAIHA